mmetsp:Transcript_34102/g.107500  ORF Transcript_34102/g.107500 Transcript_34102/m.107500 type:complete len:219 (-) Transcript_34102:272-928(-)
MIIVRHSLRNQIHLVHHVQHALARYLQEVTDEGNGNQREEDAEDLRLVRGGHEAPIAHRRGDGEREEVGACFVPGLGVKHRLEVIEIFIHAAELQEGGSLCVRHVEVLRDMQDILLLLLKLLPLNAVLHVLVYNAADKYKQANCVKVQCEREALHHFLRCLLLLILLERLLPDDGKVLGQPSHDRSSPSPGRRRRRPRHGGHPLALVLAFRRRRRRSW